MTFSPEPIAVRFDADNFWVDLEDGRTLGIPLAWFPRLLNGTAELREKFFLTLLWHFLIIDEFSAVQA